MPQIYDMGPTALLPLRRKACWGFFRPKNPTASAAFEPANLGTKGQHATPRAPKPLFRVHVRFYLSKSSVAEAIYTAFNGRLSEQRIRPNVEGIGRGLMKGTAPVFVSKDWVKSQKSKSEQSVTRRKIKFGSVGTIAVHSPHSAVHFLFTCTQGRQRTYKRNSEVRSRN